MAGALGLAVLAIASAVTRGRLPGVALPDALTHGCTAWFIAGTGSYLSALIIGASTIITAEHRRN